METTKLEQKPSSIFPNGEYEPVKKDYATLPTSVIIVFLCLIFFVLKSFIYTPDDKRKGK